MEKENNENLSEEIVKLEAEERNMTKFEVTEMDTRFIMCTSYS